MQTSGPGHFGFLQIWVLYTLISPTSLSQSKGRHQERQDDFLPTDKAILPDPTPEIPVNKKFLSA